MVSQSVDTILPEQEHSVEKLRLLESIFAKLHPDVKTDDLTALRKYDPNNAGHPQSVRPVQTKSQPQELMTSPHPNEVGGGLGDLGRHEDIGKTPMPTATITVINQGKTRT